MRYWKAVCMNRGGLFRYSYADFKIFILSL